jgi:hypothetical protein
MSINGDYDLKACIEYTQQDLRGKDVAAILAYVPGEHDGAAYYWVLGLHDASVGILRGSCDYTGWD